MSPPVNYIKPKPQIYSLLPTATTWSSYHSSLQELLKQHHLILIPPLFILHTWAKVITTNYKSAHLFSA